MPVGPIPRHAVERGRPPHFPAGAADHCAFGAGPPYDYFVQCQGFVYFVQCQGFVYFAQCQGFVYFARCQGLVCFARCQGFAWFAQCQGLGHSEEARLGVAIGAGEC